MPKHIVYFNNDQSRIKTGKPVRDLVRLAVKTVLEQEGFGRAAEVSVTFTDDVGIRELNLSSRGKDAATDVLSFPILDEGGEDGDRDIGAGATLLGDIVVSLERACVQALEYGHSFERELGFLTVHSMLHLLGYDHEQAGEESEMNEKQEKALAVMGLTR